MDVIPCTCEKNYYKAKVANDRYNDLLISFREGINITLNELIKIDDITSPLILKGRYIYEIFTDHKEEFKFSQKILY